MNRDIDVSRYGYYSTESWRLVEALKL